MSNLSKITKVLSFLGLFGSLPLCAEPLNQFQVIGSHNSYKQVMPSSALTYVMAHDPKLAKAIDYSHPPLKQQLNLGIRHFEIDLLLDPTIGMYAHPKLEKTLNQPLLSESERELLKQPGLKVLHIPDVDVKSHCNMFKECLSQLLSWSEAHPNHFPFIILVNVKETSVGFIKGQQPFTFHSKDYAQIDNEIRQVVPKEKLFTPDKLRGNYSTLEKAVLTQGWPELAELRGKFLFLFDGNPRQKSLYAAEHASLKGRAMFASFAPGQAESAFLIINDPINKFAEIHSAVKQGYMVRTRSDANLSATNLQRASRKEAAFNSGAQVISSDFYQGSIQAQEAGYSVVFNTNHFIRPNPIFHAFSSRLNN
ncbi:Ca2+-dependent phosphoinositide-specific phospholipase C [Paraglaciecola sp.]|uniref:Ca2+-dependent phosphoinositide-specific phospholipase C n=1 Tax=Paraglaciecola sp. TaxID=1920173 RepID=UPI0032645384